MLIRWSEVKMSPHAPLQRSVHSDDAACCYNYGSNLLQLLSVSTRHSVALCKPEVDEKPTANATDQRTPPTRHQPPTHACTDGGTSGAARVGNGAPPEGEVGSFPLYGWTSKNYIICACFHCHRTSYDKYIARPSSKEPRWYTDNTTGTGGLRTLDPL